MGSYRYVFPYKLLSLLFDLVATINVFYTFEDNILSSYPTVTSRSSSEYAQGRAVVLSGAAITIVTVAVEILLQFYGYTMFSTWKSFSNSTFHFLSTILLSSFSYWQWQVQAIWLIWLTTNFPPFFIQVGTLILVSLKKRQISK